MCADLSLLYQQFFARAMSSFDCLVMFFYSAECVLNAILYEVANVIHTSYTLCIVYHSLCIIKYTLVMAQYILGIIRYQVLRIACACVYFCEKGL